MTYGFGELDTLVPAYAATIHKSQGSEYPAVIIPMLTQHHPMLQRNLLYTGLTRGKRLVILVGQKKAIAIAVRKVSGKRRWSNSTIGFGSARRARRSLRSSRVEARWRRVLADPGAGSGAHRRPWLVRRGLVKTCRAYPR